LKTEEGGESWPRAVAPADSRRWSVTWWLVEVARATPGVEEPVLGGWVKRGSPEKHAHSDGRAGGGARPDKRLGEPPE
jgi:hypothetical protein